jgi:hypothetical protein
MKTLRNYKDRFIVGIVIVVVIFLVKLVEFLFA